MNSNDIYLMIKEIDEFLDDLKTKRKIIDPKEGHVQYTKKSTFGKEEENAGTLSDNLARSISRYREYKNSEHPMSVNYILECHEWITKANISGVVIENNVMQELEKCKQQCTKLEKDLDNAQSRIETLIEEKGELKKEISILARDIPKDGTLTGDVDE